MNTRKWAVPALATSIAVVGLLGVGTAVAQWNATSTGSSQAKAATAQALVVGGSTSANVLFPNMATGASLTITVQNPNLYNVQITGLTLPAAASGFTVDATSPAAAISGCTTGAQQALSYTPAATSAPIGQLNQVIQAGATLTYTVTTKLVMGDSNNNCQGAIFNFTPTVTGSSSSLTSYSTSATLTF